MADKFPTAAEVLNPHRPSGHAPFTDASFLALCEQCGEGRLLSDCRNEVTDKNRRYHCPVCNDTLVIIRGLNPPGLSVADSGIRLGDWVFANAAEILFEGYNLKIGPLRNATTFEIFAEKARGVDPAG